MPFSQLLRVRRRQSSDRAVSGIVEASDTQDGQGHFISYFLMVEPASGGIFFSHHVGYEITVAPFLNNAASPDGAPTSGTEMASVLSGSYETRRSLVVRLFSGIPPE